jgi:6-phosphogluconolactonase
LFAPLNVPAANVHRIRGEETPETGAAMASADILETLPANAMGQPILDLVILGIGPDGHTASLFPREPESMVHDKAVYRAVRNSPKPPPNRVTLGYQAIAAAKNVWVLVSGEGKEQVFVESLKPEGKTPFARVLKSRGFTKIFSDLKVG